MCIRDSVNPAPAATVFITGADRGLGLEFTRQYAARGGAYRVSNIDELIQAISGQLLVRYFSHNTLLDLLGRSRESFTHEFQSALQRCV